MTLIFLALGGVGLLLLAVSLFAGHELDLGADLHGGAPGFLSSRTLGVFPTGSGALGAVVRDRQKFNQEVLTEAASDLAKIGLGVDVLTVQKIEDKEGYIQALGKKRTAEVKRDATIGEASALREATISSTTAIREGKERENQNLALIAQAEKERDVKKATYEAEVQAQAARAKQAGPLAEARARQEVVEQEVLVNLVRTRKETEVAEAEATRRERQLQAEVVKPADAERQRIILSAEGQKQKEILGGRGGADDHVQPDPGVRPARHGGRRRPLGAARQARGEGGAGRRPARHALRWTRRHTAPRVRSPSGRARRSSSPARATPPRRMSGSSWSATWGSPTAPPTPSRCPAGPSSCSSSSTCPSSPGPASGG